jgi:flagella basal body P-ring formation protein FlgA
MDQERNRDASSKTMRAGATLGVMLLVGVAQLSWGQTVISLKQEKRIENTSVVRLDDIAWVKDRQPKIAESLGKLELFPMSRDEMVVTREQVRDRLGLLGVNLYDLHWEGARSVKLSKRDSTKSKAIEVVPAVHFDSASTSSSLDWQNQQLDRHVRKQMGSELLDQGFELESVRISTKGRDSMKSFARLGKVTFSSGDFQEGDNQAIVELESTGQVEQLPFQIVLTTCQQAVYLKKELTKGDVIQASDFEMRPVSSEQRFSNVVTNPADVVGKELVYGVNLNQPLTRSMVRDRVYVLSNRSVLVEHVNGSIRVKTYGTARQNGGLGDVVHVEVGKDKRKLVAEVVGEDRVEVK